MYESKLQTHKKKKQNLKNVRCREWQEFKLFIWGSAGQLQYVLEKFFNSSYNSVGSIASLSFFSRFVYRKWNLNKNILYRAHPSVYFIELAINNFFSRNLLFTSSKILMKLRKKDVCELSIEKLAWNKNRRKRGIKNRGTQ